MADFPDYKTVNVDSLIPYARNSRTHSDEQVAQIAASIKEFGFTNPILIDGKNGIIAGHGRILAAQKLGMNEVPVIELSHLTEAQRKAYIIADNKLALNAGWDDELLKVELGELEAMDFDLSLTGFSDEETMTLLGDGLFEEEQDTSETLGEFKYQVIVDCTGERDQSQLIERLEGEGFKCKPLML